MQDPQDVVGNFRLRKLIARKEHVAIYKAEDVRQERFAAVKIWPLKRTANAFQRATMARFQKAMALASRLKHPNIATTYEAGRSDAGVYLAREWIEGETLRAHLSRQGPMSLDDLLPIFEQIGSALDYARDQGVTHGHLHPENILLSSKGHVWVTDFSLDDPDFTAGQEILSTCVYLSPEQLEGQPADAYSDTFAFCVILYEALSGRRPFADQNVQSAVHSIQQDSPAPLLTLLHLQPVLTHALDKNPKARFERAADLLAALRTASGQEANKTPAATPVAEEPGKEEKDSEKLYEKREPIKEVTATYSYDAVAQEVPNNTEPILPQPAHPSRREQPPRSQYPILAGVAILVVFMVVLLSINVVRNQPKGRPAPSSSKNKAPASAEPTTTSWRFRLPDTQLDWRATEAEVAPPTLILSDFENSPGAWAADRLLPGSSNAVVSRVRNLAQQGSYWLKMSGVSLGTGAAQTAAFSVRPDNADLSRYGSTLSASLFLPRSAPEGLQAGLAIVDRAGKMHEQENRTPLTPGRWTTIHWDAGSLLQDVGQLKAVVYPGSQPYADYIGLDNVHMKEAASSPLLTGLTATLTSEGHIQIGDKNRLLARFGWKVSAPDGQAISQSLTTKQREADTNAVILKGTISVAGAERTSLPFTARVRAVDSDALEVELEVTPSSSVEISMLALEAQLPCALYKNASVDMIAAQEKPASTNLPVSASATAMKVASDSPIGFTLTADTPTLFSATMETVSTTFVYTAEKTLKSVNLAGDFNGWNTTATPLKRGADGRTWSATVPVLPGERQYKFVLNGGEWITDPRAAKNLRDPEGNLNSVRLVLREQGNKEPMFYLSALLAGSVDGAPVTLKTNKPLQQKFHITFNQPITNDLR